MKREIQNVKKFISDSDGYKSILINAAWDAIFSKRHDFLRADLRHYAQEGGYTITNSKGRMIKSNDEKLRAIGPMRVNYIAGRKIYGQGLDTSEREKRASAERVGKRLGDCLRRGFFRRPAKIGGIELLDVQIEGEDLVAWVIIGVQEK